MVLLLPAICATRHFYLLIKSNLLRSGNNHGTPSGTCGFGEFGRTVNDSNMTGVSRLYKNATGCGACYQVSYTSSPYCSEDGVNVVVTDYGEGDNTGFILSSRAYNRLACTGTKGAKELFARGMIDVECRRVSCRYPGYNLMFKVHEQNKYPNYLALVVIYAAGKNDITAVELCQEDCKHWRGMHKAFGVVWDMSNEVPSGSIKLRFKASSSGWVESKNDLPAFWKSGVAYDSEIQL
ncbi:hypothetical protein I3843_11G076800 [Carya illinoinensis]|uniref:Expansin-like B1 n=1 Tax=Carya illinoinensis TaxID=32201 RepID=A0A922DNM0_CARIL|nr:hypothetical protein I3842_11G077000 [Carya illinoinensis]KAG7955523.1 hypothetical protein I3843_11G076800 [Carya illinoinensis]